MRKASRRKKPAVHTIDAITLDILELSAEKPEVASEYSWLTKFISQMSDEQVAAKMKHLKNSSIDIDDALAERLILEEL